MQKRIFSILALIAVICFAVYTLNLPIVCDISPRSYVRMVLVDSAAMRKRIVKDLSDGEPISEAGGFSVQGKASGKGLMDVDFGWVTQQGSILIYNKEYGIVIVQEPTKTKDGIAWNCVIYPEAKKPIVDVCKL